MIRQYPLTLDLLRERDRGANLYGLGAPRSTCRTPLERAGWEAARAAADRLDQLNARPTTPGGTAS